MFSLTTFIDHDLGLAHPLTYFALFLAASLLLVWRLEAMLDNGLEGTALGALFMPLCSGLGNLLFVAVAHQRGIAPAEIAVNSLGNNLTNLLLILPLVALTTGLSLRAAEKPKKASRKAKGPAPESLHLLALFLTLGAATLFPIITWALALDGKLDRGDGFALIALFLLWQSFHLYDVRKHQLVNRQRISPLVFVDALLALGAAYLLLISLDWIVDWLSKRPADSLGSGHLGWITAWLMVLPNAAFAAFYAFRRRADIVYSSQIGDGHICIPLCLGLAAAFFPFAPPAWFGEGLLILAGAAVFHTLSLTVFKGLPRPFAFVPLAAYGWCLYQGLG